MTESIWPKIGKNLTKKNSHRQTGTLELDRKITPTNMNGWTWPKYPWKWLEFKSALNSLGWRTWTVEYDLNNHSVMLNWSNDYSSHWITKSGHFKSGKNKPPLPLSSIFWTNRVIMAKLAVKLLSKHFELPIWRLEWLLGCCW